MNLLKILFARSFGCSTIARTNTFKELYHYIETQWFANENRIKVWNVHGTGVRTNNISETFNRVINMGTSGRNTVLSIVQKIEYLITKDKERILSMTDIEVSNQSAFYKSVDNFIELCTELLERDEMFLVDFLDLTSTVGHLKTPQEIETFRINNLTENTLMNKKESWTNKGYSNSQYIVRTRTRSRHSLNEMNLQLLNNISETLTRSLSTYIPNILTNLQITLDNTEQRSLLTTIGSTLSTLVSTSLSSLIPTTTLQLLQTNSSLINQQTESSSESLENDILVANIPFPSLYSQHRTSNSITSNPHQSDQLTTINIDTTTTIQFNDTNTLPPMNDEIHHIPSNLNSLNIESSSSSNIPLFTDQSDNTDSSHDTTTNNPMNGSTIHHTQTSIQSRERSHYPIHPIIPFPTPVQVNEKEDVQFRGLNDSNVTIRFKKPIYRETYVGQKISNQTFTLEDIYSCDFPLNYLNLKFDAEN